MKKVGIVIGALMAGSLNAAVSSVLDYGKAIVMAQQGDWKNSQERLRNLIIDAPDRADLLYDAGVAAYRLAEHEKAAAYFDAAAHKDDGALKQQALFNRGNAQVALKKYHEAIDAYESVLKREPDHEPARHNLEKVRQLLAQQENKQQQQGNNDQQKDSQDQQQEQQSDAGDGQGKNDKQKDAQQGKQQNNEQKEGDQDEDKKSGNDAQQSAGKEDKKEGGKQNKQGKKKDDSNKEANEQQTADKNDELSDNHDSSSGSKKSESQPTKNDTKSQEIQAGAIDDGEKERKEDDRAQLLEQLGADKKWMAQILDRQEKADEKAQKKLVKATVDKALAGEHGQNCW